MPETPLTLLSLPYYPDALLTALVLRTVASHSGLLSIRAYMHLRGCKGPELHQREKHLKKLLPAPTAYDDGDSSRSPHLWGL